MSRIIKEKVYEVHHYEADSNGKIFFASLMNYLENIAVLQVEDLGIGIDYLNEHKLGWVVYKWDVKINKHAKAGEELKVRTWPFSYRKFYAYRQYEVVNQEGEIIATANSLWFLIDTEKRRPCKITQEITRRFGLEENQNDMLDFEKLKEPVNISIDKTFRVRYSDIDLNKHVNNTKYISWTLESVPYEVLTNCTLKELIISYEKETNYGETVKVLGEIIESEDEYIVVNSVLNESNEKLTLVKTVWRK